MQAAAHSDTSRGVFKRERNLLGALNDVNSSTRVLAIIIYARTLQRTAHLGLDIADGVHITERVLTPVLVVERVGDAEREGDRVLVALRVVVGGAEGITDGKGKGIAATPSSMLVADPTKRPRKWSRRQGRRCLRLRRTTYHRRRRTGHAGTGRTGTGRTGTGRAGTGPRCRLRAPPPRARSIGEVRYGAAAPRAVGTRG